MGTGLGGLTRMVLGSDKGTALATGTANGCDCGGWIGCTLIVGIGVFGDDAVGLIFTLGDSPTGGILG
jgi:hypothetical protein